MKQQINITDLRELSDSECEVLLRWLVDKGYERFMTIGQMIEFLSGDYWTAITYFPPEGTVYMMQSVNAGVQPSILCDTLWDAVKAKLRSLV